MLDLIVAQLKTGPWKRVVPFGSKVPEAPYLVVREEPNTATTNGRTRYRITGHHKPEYYMDLRSYMRSTIYDLLNEKELTGSDNRRIVVSEERGSLTECTAQSDDGSISIERAFLVPDILSIGG